MIPKHVAIIPTPKRLVVDITEEQYERLSKIFEHGERKLYFQALIEATINIYDDVGKIALYAMIGGQTDIMRSLTKHQKKVGN
jgi:hypothetical protein